MKAYVFPGQGAQFTGMGKDLFDSSELAKSLFKQANDSLGFDITRIMFEGEKSDILLNRFLPLDLRLDNFPINSSASSAIHHVSVKLFRINKKEFHLFIPRGFALSIWEILLDSASQFGYEIKDH